MPNVWAIVAACVALLAVFLLVVYMICRKFSKGTDMFKHWPFYLSAVVGLILLLRFGVSLTTVKGMILTLLLLYASLSDFKKREVPDCISVMILILAFVGFEHSNLLSMLAGAAVVFIPQLATTMLTPNRPIGGADIKISTALAFLLGAEKGIFALVVGMLLAVVITAISNKLNDRDKKQAFQLVPFLWIGATLAYMI
jgi:leader peptidase (prepilin peptidase)/N-methyltransferase